MFLLKKINKGNIEKANSFKTYFGWLRKYALFYMICVLTDW